MKALAAAMVIPLWAVLGTASARSADFCGHVQVLGRDLPAGYVTLTSDRRSWHGEDELGGDIPHPGTAQRTLSPLTNGRFCLRDISAGNYRVAISPLSCDSVMPISFRGLNGDAASYRLSVAASGRASVYDAAGRRGSEGPLELQYMDSDPSADWTTLKGTLNYPKAVNDSPGVMHLVEIRSRDEKAAEILFHRFLWVRPRAGAAQAFELRVPPGRLLDIIVWAKDVVVAATDPLIHARHMDHTLVFGPAQDVPISIDLEPIAGHVKGRATTQDGRPLKPNLGQGGKQEWFQLKFSRMGGGHEFHFTLDEDGRYDAPLPAGLWYWKLYRIMDSGFVGGVLYGNLRVSRAEPEIPLNFSFSDIAYFRLKKDAVALEPMQDPASELYPQISRSFSGMKCGSRAPSDYFRLFAEEEVPLHLAQGRNGFWKGQAYLDDSESDNWYAAPAGCYDLFLFDLDTSADGYLVIRASATSVELRPGARNDISLSNADYRAPGRAELRGTIRSSAKWGPSELKDADFVAQLYMRKLYPFVNLYDQEGRLAAMGIPLASEAVLKKAVEEGDWEGFRALFRSTTFEYRIAGLPPGRYRVEIVDYGYAPRDMEVELREGPPARFDIDMDRL